jgi:hypothetical protein
VQLGYPVDAPAYRCKGGHGSITNDESSQNRIMTTTDDGLDATSRRLWSPKRERAALDVLALLPEWWAVGPTSYDPGIRRWSYTARGPHPGRGKHPETIAGGGMESLPR